MVDPTDPVPLLSVSNLNGYMLVTIPGVPDSDLFRILAELQDLCLIHPEYKHWDIGEITWQVVHIDIPNLTGDK